jgi:hypothetical protein
VLRASRTPGVFAAVAAAVTAILAGAVATMARIKAGEL